MEADSAAPSAPSTSTASFAHPAPASLPPSGAKRGRPKGSKDKPRPPGAQPRGRPRKKRVTEKSRSVPADEELADDEYEAFFENEVYDFDDLDAIENRHIGAPRSQLNPAPLPQERQDDGHQAHAEASRAKRAELDEAAKSTNARPFFTSAASYDDEVSDSDTDPDSGCDDDSPGTAGRGAQKENTQKVNAKGNKCWFVPPKGMASWLVDYFIDEIGPSFITAPKNGRQVKEPPCFTGSGPLSPPTLWINPPEAVFLLAQHRLKPAVLFRPRVFLWLPHFFVKALKCPNCKCRTLEKNGPICPRRIYDVEDNFYIISWRYYCREGCRASFQGWSSRLIASLPRYLQLAFPAILSHRSGLSKAVVKILCVANQHKMGPSGIRSLLVELHTRRFNRLQLQYLESAFEVVRGHEESSTGSQLTLDSFMGSTIPKFGGFWDKDLYGGTVPSERYLTTMMNKAIELDEHNANQHTACLPMDQISIDDSFKISKHVATVDGVGIAEAMWTCMDSHYIRGQVLTLTKSHEERLGPLRAIAHSLKRYGYPDPPVAFTDDPIKDKSLLTDAFPSLGENLTPMAKAYGLKELRLPDNPPPLFLDTHALVEGALSPLVYQLEDDSSPPVVLSIDAEWNVSRTSGVSVLQIAPHSEEDIYIIPVHKFNHLPPSLLRILLSTKVYKVGNAIKADFTRMKKQFTQLRNVGTDSLKLIDLKEYCVQRGIIQRSGSGTLDTLLEKALGMYLAKDDCLRKSDEWERGKLHDDLLQYAAKDVYASKLIFAEAEKRTPLQFVDSDTPPGTRVVLSTQEDGQVVARGRVSDVQPNTFTGIRVKVPSRSRLLIDIDEIICPSATPILHLVAKGKSSKTDSGTYTLEQLHNVAQSKAQPLQIVALTSHLRRESDYLLQQSEQLINQLRGSATPAPQTPAPNIQQEPDTSGDGIDDDREAGYAEDEYDDTDMLYLTMLEAYEAALGDTPPAPEDLNDELAPLLKRLDEIIASPPDKDDIYTRIKKDIFHAFHSLPIPRQHAMRIPFLRALRDHLMRWDPVAKARVEKVCQERFKMSFDDMLRRRPRWILERTPRFVPSPSVLVAAIQYVYDMFKDAVDAKTGVRLFTPAFQEKANAVLELARQGYLSDLPNVPMYVKSGIDQYGLQRWRCLRGTNNVEGGPHGDIYRKFGALNAGPELTVNSLTDHRTWYNLQAFAKFEFGVNWEYHHDLGMINRTSFLLGYLSEYVDGARSYAMWPNPDRYERTTEQFGICRFPDSLQMRYNMSPYSKEAAMMRPLKAPDDWLRKRQGLALPIMPPTTQGSRTYFFEKMRAHTRTAAADGRKRVDMEGIVREWNETANGTDRFYVTVEVLMAYMKTWETFNNSQASQESIAAELATLKTSRAIFDAPDIPFPQELTTEPTHVEPMQGVVDWSESGLSLPASLSTAPTVAESRGLTDALWRAHFTAPSTATSPDAMITPGASISPAAANPSGIEPHSMPTPPSLPAAPSLHNSVQSPAAAPSLPAPFTFQFHEPTTSATPIQAPPPAPISKPKRKRVLPSDKRKREKVRSCRRCNSPECDGKVNILFCATQCTVPCAKCGHFERCKGVDKGRICKYPDDSGNLYRAKKAKTSSESIART